MEKRKAALFKCLIVLALEPLIGDTANWNQRSTQIKSSQVKCWFLRRGETGAPGEYLSVQSREPTNSTHIWRRIWESNPGHIGGRRVLSPLRHPWIPKKCIQQKV